ncbi:MAG: hypothetical protein IJJ28_03100 [Lentisphaeria bacterium]|nr:hypothetical protein [Lentisphaeria bacterium]
MSRLIDPMEPMEYINHPNEVLRLLRYFVRPQLDPAERITPDYSSDPQLGVVISTYGSIPFLDLNLHYLVHVNHLRVLVHDDCSPRRNELIALCRSYAPYVDLYSTPERMWHKEKIGVLGDTNSFLIGVQWARQNGFELLLKLSRRMVVLKEFAPALKRLAVESDAFTFGNYCGEDDFPLRTECVALSVKGWSHPFPLGQLNAVVQAKLPVFAEYWFHDLARMLAYANASERYRRYADTHRIGASHDGFVLWNDLLGSSRYEPTPGALWHSSNPLEDYYNAARAVFGDRYTLDDFRGIEMF